MDTARRQRLRSVANSGFTLNAGARATSINSNRGFFSAIAMETRQIKPDVLIPRFWP
jgi:hypothetical protein